MSIFSILLRQDTIYLVELWWVSEPRQGRQQRRWEIDNAIVDQTTPDLTARVVGMGRKRSVVEEGRVYADALPRQLGGRGGLQRKRAFYWEFGFVQQPTCIGEGG